LELTFQNMKNFEILEHTADLKVKVFGKTKKDLFENAMIGMLKAAKYQKKLKSQNSKVKIKIKSMDLPSLLVDFLSEILYLVETKKIVFEKIEFKKFKENEIEAILIGKPLKRMGGHIKGVTYHDLDVHQEKDKTWQATILFDI
jgi:SHS2 domain-containing protein